MLQNELPDDMFYIPSIPAVPDLPKSVQIYEGGCPAIVEIKPQSDTAMYEDETALKEGTLFRCLKKPFKGGTL